MGRKKNKNIPNPSWSLSAVEGQEGIFEPIMPVAEALEISSHRNPANIHIAFPFFK